MLKQQANTFEGLARAADLGAIAISFLASGALCSRLKNLKASVAWIPGHTLSPYPPSSDQYVLLFLTSLAAWVLVSQWRATYSSSRAERPGSILKSDLITQAWWVLLVGYIAFFLKLDLLSRTFFFVYFPLTIATLNLRQTGSRTVLRYFRTQGFNLRDVVIIGNKTESEQLGELIQEDAKNGYRVIYQDELDANENTHSFDEAFILTNSGTAELALRLVKQGKRVHFVPCILDARQFRQSLSEVAGIPVLSLGGHGLSRPEAVAKRSFDIVGSLALLIILSPLLALIGVLIKMSSRGPMLFKQERVGEGGRRFQIYKFRTMKQNAEAILQSSPALYAEYIRNNYKLPKGGDPRITRIGALLRTSSLDELPQLLNVLKGDMSLVGPRPVVPPEIDKYGDYAQLFLCVKPGLTGNWQIHGRSEISDYSHRAALDIEYIRDQSLKNDVDILLKTIPAVLLRKGAH